MDLLGLIVIPTWLLVILLLLITAYVYYTWEFGAFEGSGLQGPKAYPVVGTQGPSFAKGMLPVDLEIMTKYGRIVKMFICRTPTIFTTDEEFIKAVHIKEFNSFLDRVNFSNGNDFFADALTNVCGDKWRRLRHLMSPTFSTGKMKRMSSQINKCAKILTDNMEEYAKSGKPCDIKELSQAFTMDNIAATLFGLELNTQNDPNSLFVKYGKKLTNFGQFNPVFLVVFFFPFMWPILRLLNISMFDTESCDFFSKLTKKAIEERKLSNLDSTAKQVDFVQLLLDAHLDKDEDNDVTDKAFYNDTKNAAVNKKRLSDKEMNSQALLFFLAGYENIASTLTFLCYYLAVYPEVQEKLYQEIQKHTDGKDMVEYNTLSEMKYLDQCINETLRLIPLGFRTERTCSSDVTIKGIHIKKGWLVIVPVYALHRDPELWEDPDEFIPERFEDMSKIGCKYMPFGVGPRICIGMRLALMEVKIAAIHLLRNYKFLKTPDTLFPMQFDTYKFLQPIKPIQLGLERRE